MPLYPLDEKSPWPVPGERIELDGSVGRIMGYVSGVSAPLLLIHSINAAASAAEVGISLSDRPRSAD
jgi:hypothetical protein